ncbi:hypothetical protein BD626DRAFT_560288 [Schizophyllum amplum]|uniref:AB hydrolase-1 domain-containing protein n=1 Tax=Schizophyllum amplum TaxID=97359 RepID=A0A550BYI7_9AGAR|nr:hypothetical protein BD626DRAFT_560288 [Auriculariopsis ampla]
MSMSYPPPQDIPKPQSVPPLPLLPIEPPDLHGFALPSLLSDNTSDEIPGFTYSKHLIPACRTRSVPASYDMPTADPRALASKELRKAEMQRVGAAMKDLVASEEWWQSPPVGFTPDAPLFNCLGRFRRTSDSGARLTLFFAHANGFNKEVCCPSGGCTSLTSVLCTLRAPDMVCYPPPPFHRSLRCRHSGSVGWEAVQHGEAALINRAALRGLYSWRDNARDILNFLLHFIPAEASHDSLPAHLPRVPSAETATRRVAGLTRRHVVAIGHSFGGCTRCAVIVRLLATNQLKLTNIVPSSDASARRPCSALATLTPPYGPLLIRSLVLIDPVIMAPKSGHNKSGLQVLASGAVGRRGQWASREDAREQFLASPFFQRWDPEVLDAYVQNGLYEQDGQVHLCMSPHDEALMFAEGRTSWEVYKRLPSLTSDVELRWIMPGRDRRRMLNSLGSAEEAERRVWLRPENASNVRIEGAGHLIPHEKPEQLGALWHSFTGTLVYGFDST